VTLRRRYFTCRHCGTHAHPLDERLGVDGFVSPHAQRLLCLLGAEHAFERAARLLREVAGLCVCDNTVRRICDEHGGKMRAWQRDEPEAARPFREAEGQVEFQTDGTCVNTTGGWREIRLSIFAKRVRGEPIRDLDAWDDQRLPEPTARIATAAIRTAATLGPQWRRAAGRLGITSTAELTVLADGAKWIWGEANRNLPGAALVLDIYHASEHLHAAALAGHGDGPAATGWFRARRRTLLESGVAGVLGEGSWIRRPEAPRNWPNTCGRTSTTRPIASGWPRVARSAAGWSRGPARRPSASGSSRPGPAGEPAGWSGWPHCAAWSTATSSRPTGDKPPVSDQIPLPHPPRRVLCDDPCSPSSMDVS
jgi:hypothetical protein